MPRKTDAPQTAPTLYARASMRPRPDATENGGARLLPRLHLKCFNEAAARCHGKLRR